MTFQDALIASKTATPLTLIPTAEQNIIFQTFHELLYLGRTPENNLLVDALAGTGKSTTILQLASLNPERLFLMVCFGNKNSAELTAKCRKHGIYNLEASTLHKIAYDWYFAETGKSPKPILNVDWVKENISSKFVFDSRKQLDVAWGVTKLVKAFCNSAYLDFAAFWGSDDSYRKLDENILVGAEVYIQAALNLNTDSTIPITLDGMIKTFELFGGRLASPEKILVIEEYQDINSNQANILAKQENFKIAIGDANQNIYEWRGGGEFVSIVEAQGWETRSLTSSFRINAKDAELANIILQAVNSENLTLKGLSTKTEIETTAYLSRSNASALLKAVELFAEKKRFALTLDLPGITNELWYLHHLNKDDIRGKKVPPSLSWIKTKARLLEAVENVPEIKRLWSLFNLLNRQQGGLYGMLKKFEALAKETEGRVLPITLSTIHKAKGLEWDEVVLHADVFESLPSFETPVNREEQLAALRLLYVAVTRAKVRTLMPEELETFIENLI